jgi:hemerythrin-like metal-binding protein
MTEPPRTDIEAGVLVLGASTGGAEALAGVLASLPAESPATLIVQHMPAEFTASFADRLAATARLAVRVALDGDALRPGLALVAPGDVHMRVRRVASGYAIALRSGPRVNHHRPSIDVLFRSVARAGGAHAVGALLSGIGSDGAKGLLAMRQAGALTLAQNEATSRVFGTARMAEELGGVAVSLPLQEIPAALLGPFDLRPVASPLPSRPAAATPSGWDESGMAIGIPRIDEDHRLLVSSFDLLVQAMRQGDGSQRVQPMLRFLEEYMVRHFRYEEALMRKYDCPSRVRNREQHRSMARQHQELALDYARHGATPELLRRLHDSLARYLREHICHVDGKLRSCPGVCHDYGSQAQAGGDR